MNKAVIFDLYGTLIYLADETSPYLKLFLDLGLDGEKKAEAKKIAMTENFSSLAKLVNRIAPNSQINLHPHEEAIRKEAASAKLYPETKAVLGELRRRNIDIGLVSNVATPYKKAFFDLGLDDYFNHKLFSCDIGLQKPDPRIYKKIIQNMGINSSLALMIGDKLTCDVDTPKSIGMNAVYLDRINHSPNSISTLESLFSYL